MVHCTCCDEQLFSSNRIACFLAEELCQAGPEGSIALLRPIPAMQTQHSTLEPRCQASLSKEFSYW
jgi:hypothetical protein